MDNYPDSFWMGTHSGHVRPNNDDLSDDAKRLPPVLDRAAYDKES